MEGDYKKFNSESTKQTGPRSSEKRFHGAVVLSLGLLSVFLLVGLISVCVHYRGLTEERDLLNANLTETTKELHDLQSLSMKNHDVIRGLTEERDLLNANLTETTKELQRLENLTKQRETCPAGWKMFNSFCYYFSSDQASWSTGRQFCRDRGADLVVIDSLEEQKFLSTFTVEDTLTWIGLTDIDTEGTWKWVDGTSPTLSYWRSSQPDNGGGDPRWGEEDCAHIDKRYGVMNNWNDVSCGATYLWWICEKNADV